MTNEPLMATVRCAHCGRQILKVARAWVHESSMSTRCQRFGPSTTEAKPRGRLGMFLDDEVVA